MEEKSQGVGPKKNGQWESFEHEGFTIEASATSSPINLIVRVFLKGDHVLTGRFSETDGQLEYADHNRAPSYRTRKYIRDYAFHKINQLKEQT